MTPDNGPQNKTPNMPLSDIEMTKQKFTKTDRGNEVLHDMDTDEVNKYITVHGLNPELVRSWTKDAEDLLAEHGSDFNVFVEGHQILVEEGNAMLKQLETTGFNIDRFDVFADPDFFEKNKKISIYYSNQIDRPEHFGLLLAKMTKEDLLKDVAIELNCKATKVEWEYDATSPTIPTEIIQRSDGTERAVGRSVELVVRFSLDYDQGVAILAFFQKNVFLLRGGYIPGSWVDPDIRVLPDLLGNQMTGPIIINSDLSNLYVSVVNNGRKLGNGKMLVLRGKTSFSAKKAGWESEPIMVNKELAKFISGGGIPE